MASCDVLLALIGPHWLTMTDAEGNRRLDDPEDFVRLELSAALNRGVRVVPILVDGATMPKVSDLPAELVPIIRRQAVEINPVGFNTERLLTTLSALLERPATPMPAVDISAAPGPAAADDPTPPAPARGGPEEPSPRSASGPEEPSPRSTSGPEEPSPRSTGPVRRTPMLIGAGVVVVVVALAVGLLVWRPWARSDNSRSTAGSSSASAGAPVTPSAPTSSAAALATLANPPILAHRGGLEHHQLETMQAMEAAAREGFAIETDVRFTSDGVAVLVHDEAASKGLDCGGADIKVSKTPWAKLKETLPVEADLAGRRQLSDPHPQRDPGGDRRREPDRVGVPGDQDRPERRSP
ncbi:glycerophosphodiester phosphodiesterase [Micropruina sonneratiae]|uniref:glycerophosphodiester phosphodiesterase n=1 Tax=Micropruina sonneratiae TaxID=2986940 RepID=UPI002226D1B2|nr:glycerophosphodiester phosphodiesterase family protein [Micropruina sp. KQZ13P-5]MCW3158187.1 glycerophosphodiester phosphodiesterase family protein [Micropruina sp. KQZ13P-5]